MKTGAEAAQLMQTVQIVQMDGNWTAAGPAVDVIRASRRIRSLERFRKYAKTFLAHLRSLRRVSRTSSEFSNLVWLREFKYNLKLLLSTMCWEECGKSKVAAAIRGKPRGFSQLSS